MIYAEDRIDLNRWAAKPRFKRVALEWFRQQDAERRREILREVGAMALQAGCVPSDTDPATETFGLKPGWTPLVLMRLGSPKVQLATVLGLPEEEEELSLLTLLALLGVADARRRTARCATGCPHWWHRDLEDATVRNSILQSGEAGRPRG